MHIDAARAPPGAPCNTTTTTGARQDLLADWGLTLDHVKAINKNLQTYNSSTLLMEALLTEKQARTTAAQEADEYAELHSKTLRSDVARKNSKVITVR